MQDIKGFLSIREAQKLQELFQNVYHLGAVVEIGTYCGKSAINFAEIADEVGGIIYTIDHHSGSEEHQLGEEYHDEDLYDERLGKFNTLPEFLRNLTFSKKGKFIIPILEESKKAAETFSEKICLLFIDGGHSKKAALEDYESWKGKFHLVVF